MVEVVAALIRDGDRFMVCRRPAWKARGLKWEFVGGKVEPGESRAQALMRECREELDIEIETSDESVFMEVDHVYPDITIHLTLMEARIVRGTPKLLEHCAIDWITPDMIGAYEFCPADKEILEKLQEQSAG
jgi:8-oxo-dGTP diphosphatase